MKKDVNAALLSACRLLLRPIALLLLKGGVTWREFSELSKSVFVSVATDAFGISGRPTNVSRVSILTGISRKEVKRQRDLLEAEVPESSSKTTDATRLLSGWHQDRDYLDPAGQPLALPLAGDKPSFKSLFETYGGDTPEQTLLKELRQANSIKDEAGRVIAARRYHMPGDLDPGGLRFFGTNLFDHGRTLASNVGDVGAPKWLEGFAVDDRVHPEAVEAFREFIDERGQQFLEEVDAWLGEHRADANGSDTTPVRLGLGVYAIAGPLPEGTQS
ncbi:MAG: DUF6502 family protein [Pseudomonadota bacterium]